MRSRLVGPFLLLACLPSLVLNAGPGRGMLFHEHGDDDSVHAHVVAASRHGNHVHWHAHDHEHVGDRDHHDAHDGHDDQEQRDDCTVVPGTELASLKRQKDVTNQASVPLDSTPRALTDLAAPGVAQRCCDPYGPPPDAPSGDRARLRTIVLLI